MKEEYEWQKCYKIDCTPAIEIFKKFVRVNGTNYDVDSLDSEIERQVRKAELFKEIKRKWNKEFNNK